MNAMVHRGLHGLLRAPRVSGSQLGPARVLQVRVGSAPTIGLHSWSVRGSRTGIGAVGWSEFRLLPFAQVSPVCVVFVQESEAPPRHPPESPSRMRFVLVWRSNSALPPCSYYAWRPRLRFGRYFSLFEKPNFLTPLDFSTLGLPRTAQRTSAVAYRYLQRGTLCEFDRLFAKCN